MAVNDSPAVPIGQHPHTVECRDEYCTHPIQCELDRVCPASPGGEADELIRSRDDWCNCQAVPGTPHYPGPWHPRGDQTCRYRLVSEPDQT